MANLNSEAILASRSYMCGKERKLHTHALARLASPGQARARARARAKDAGVRRPCEWSAEIRLVVLRGHGFLLLFYFFCSLAIKFMRYGRSSRFPNLIMDPITMQGRGLSYIYNLLAATNTRLI